MKTKRLLINRERELLARVLPAYSRRG